MRKDSRLGPQAPPSCESSSVSQRRRPHRAIALLALVVCACLLGSAGLFAWTSAASASGETNGELTEAARPTTEEGGEGTAPTEAALSLESPPALTRWKPNADRCRASWSIVPSR